MAFSAQMSGRPRPKSCTCVYERRMQAADRFFLAPKMLHDYTAVTKTTTSKDTSALHEDLPLKRGVSAYSIERIAEVCHWLDNQSFSLSSKLYV